MLCPKPDQFSASDLMQCVTYRAELVVTRKFSEEMKQFSLRMAETYSEKAVSNAFQMLKGHSKPW